MTVTVLKTFFRKLPPKLISYRNYNNFAHHIFRNEIIEKLRHNDLNELSYEKFEHIIVTCLNIHAPIKRKYIRANESPFMTKELRKAIMVRSKLKNKFNKIKTDESKLMYNKQRNKCTSLLRKTKKNYFNRLNPSVITDNKKFWKIIKPLFSEKCFTNENITLIEKNEIIEDDNKISEIFNDFFTNAVKNLNIEIDQNILNNVDGIKDPILKAIKKYQNIQAYSKLMKINYKIRKVLSLKKLLKKLKN